MNPHLNWLKLCWSAVVNLTAFLLNSVCWHDEWHVIYLGACICFIGVSHTVYRTAIESTHQPGDSSRCNLFGSHSNLLPPNTTNVSRAVGNSFHLSETAWWEKHSSTSLRTYLLIQICSVTKNKPGMLNTNRQHGARKYRFGFASHFQYFWKK